MRLTSPRWARAVATTTGSGAIRQNATVDWLHSLANHDIKRRDVVNPELCDEALALLRPSLPSPSTCDIIDINPGAGVWSKKLNEALKPRRHVFIETEYHNYQDALTPLLQHPESRYRIAPTIQDALDEKQDFLSAQLRYSYASSNQLSRESVRRSPTSQLVITANLAQKAVRANGFLGKMSKLFFEHFYRNTTMGTGAFPWHKYGLVKLLAWIPEADKNSFNPRCSSFRYRATGQLEASCEIREIVASFPNDGRRNQTSPWYGAAVDSARETAAIQSASGLEIPYHRQQPLPKPPSIFFSPIPENFSQIQSVHDKPPLVNQWIAAYKSMKASDPEWLDSYMSDNDWFRKNRVPDKNDPRWVFARYHTRMRTTHGRYAKVDEVARAQVELERQLIAFRQENPEDIAGYLELVEQLRPRFNRLKERRKSFFKDNRSAAIKAIDDYRAFNYTPHLLNWNQRTFEPLLCHPREDFYPHQPMSLLEVTPRPDFVNTINTADLQIAFDYISHVLDLVRITSVKKALETLVGSGEAYEKFVGKFGEPGGIPSLTDPLYGGSHDLDDVRLRTLSARQMVDIALAYEAWPFRLSLNDMIDRVSTYNSGRKVM